MNQQTFIFIGRSGCGKGTQARLLSDYLKKLRPEQNTVYISSGAELREFIKGPTLTQKLAKEIYDKGGLQPEFLIVNLWAGALVRDYTGTENIIMDGMPRKYHEAGVLDSIFDYYKIPRPLVIHLEISNEESTKRLLARKRFDDIAEEIANRLSWYDTDVVPTIEYYRKNKAYRLIDVNGERPIEEIFKEIVANINPK
jgi:adenylate kinase